MNWNWKYRCQSRTHSSSSWGGEFMSYVLSILRLQCLQDKVVRTLKKRKKMVWVREIWTWKTSEEWWWKSWWEITQGKCSEKKPGCYSHLEEVRKEEAGWRGGGGQPRRRESREGAVPGAPEGVWRGRGCQQCLYMEITVNKGGNKSHQAWQLGGHWWHQRKVWVQGWRPQSG